MMSNSQSTAPTSNGVAPPRKNVDKGQFNDNALVSASVSRTRVPLTPPGLDPPSRRRSNTTTDGRGLESTRVLASHEQVDIPDGESDLTSSEEPVDPYELTTPGNTVYRGRTTRSRVALCQDARDISPPVTRRSALLARRAAQPEATAPVDPQSAPVPPESKDVELPVEPPKPRPKPRPHKVKKPSSGAPLRDVDARHEQIDDPATTSPSRAQRPAPPSHTPLVPQIRAIDQDPRAFNRVPQSRLKRERPTRSPDRERDQVSQRRKRTRRREPSQELTFTPLPPKVPLRQLPATPEPPSEDEEFPPVIVPNERPALDEQNTFIDDEAEDDDSDHMRDDERVPSEDRYDYEDSFIDDSSIRGDEDGSVEDVPNCEEVGDAAEEEAHSDTDMDVDGVYPGVEDPDPVVSAHVERYRNRRRNEQDYWDTRVSIDRNNSFILGALDSLYPAPTSRTSAQSPTKKDSWSGLARRQSMLTHLRPWVSKKAATRQSDAAHSKKGKGKQKAPLNNDETNEHSDYKSSDLSPAEQVELDRAIEESRRPSNPAQSAGQSSRQRMENVNAPTAPATPSTPGRKAPHMKMGQVTPKTPTQSPSSSPSTPSPQSSDSPGSSPGNVHMYCTQLPTKCQVSDPTLQDPLLEYDNLPPLTEGQLIPWSDTPGPGQVRFCAWGDQCPDMDADLAFNAVLFVQAEWFVNPSRASPLNMGTVSVGGGSGHRCNLYCDGRPMIAVSAGFLEFSQVTQPSSTGLPQRFVRIIMHSQEWERFVAFVCMVFGVSRLHAQLFRDAIQISTRSQGSYSGGSSSDKSGPASKMFTMKKSSSTVGNGNRVNADGFTLPNDVAIPVFDARQEPTFDFNTDLPNLASRLPRWESEIPQGSFVVVGYTISVYCSGAGNMTLGCNLQWVVIVGTPDQ